MAVPSKWRNLIDSNMADIFPISQSKPRNIDSLAGRAAAQAFTGKEYGGKNWNLTSQYVKGIRLIRNTKCKEPTVQRFLWHPRR